MTVEFNVKIQSKHKCVAEIDIALKISPKTYEKLRNGALGADGTVKAEILSVVIHTKPRRDCRVPKIRIRTICLSRLITCKSNKIYDLLLIIKV